MQGNPVRHYHDAYRDPLYARAAEAGVPLTFHRTFGGRPNEADAEELTAGLSPEDTTKILSGNASRVYGL